MATLVVRGPGRVAGAATVPGDKSICHRALMLAATAKGRSRIGGLAPGRDVASTARCLVGYGVGLRVEGDVAEISGDGIADWNEPTGPLDCGNSGTTMRLLAGLAARHRFVSSFAGDESLQRRPMDRIAAPLRALGARVAAREGRFPPIDVSGGDLHGTRVELQVASAQVKSCLLLAGLGASGTTSVVSPAPTRDHTERMLAALGVGVRSARLESGAELVEVEAADIPPVRIDVPGDTSSAAFLAAAAVLTGSIRVHGLLLNPTRTGFFETLVGMGAAVRWEVSEERLGEPVGLVEAEVARLTGVTLESPVIPGLIDELPLVAVLATQASGPTTVSGAAELRVKESDRIAAVAEGLRRLGATVNERPDGFAVEGPMPLRGATVDAWGDHRIAMALAVAGLVAEGETRIAGWEAADVSWPRFADTLAALGADCEVFP